jgi:hypothetical protein
MDPATKTRTRRDAQINNSRRMLHELKAQMAELERIKSFVIQRLRDTEAGIESEKSYLASLMTDQVILGATTPEAPGE